MSHRAVVFAYHDIGVRGLATLLAHRVEVPLVVTHRDDPGENRWFGSVAELAARETIPVITPEDPNLREVVERVGETGAEWLFSFYYRHLLGDALLELPARGAYNLHGSLLPRYRGRAPVNWAVLHGERETGASLHRMVERPDAGELVAQEGVPILTNDTALEVFRKVTCAAERLLDRTLPALLAGRAAATPLDLGRGSYYGRRRPEDGRIDWRASAWQVHNLVRAVAPPYPGAFFEARGRRVQVLGSHYRGEPARRPGAVRLYWEAGRCHADCADGERILLAQLALDGEQLDEHRFRTTFDGGTLTLETEQATR